MPTLQQERIAHARRVFEGGNAQERRDAAMWLAANGVITSLNRPQVRRNVAANTARERRQQAEQAAIDQQFGIKSTPAKVIKVRPKSASVAGRAAIARAKANAGKTTTVRHKDGTITRQ